MRPLIFLILFTLSLSSFGYEVCVRVDCTRSADSSFLCKLKNPGSDGYVAVNGVGVPFYEEYSDRDRLDNTYKACFSHEEYLVDGVNTIFYNGFFGVSAQGWLRKEVYITVDGERTVNICDVIVASDGATECELDHRFSLFDLVPELRRTLEDAIAHVKYLEREVDVYEAKLRERVAQVGAVLRNIEPLDFNQLTEAQLRYVDDALALYQDLKKNLQTIRDEVSVKRAEFEVNLNELNDTIDSELSTQGIESSDYDIDHPLTIPEIEIPTIVDDVIFSPDNDFYAVFADQTILELDSLFQAGDNLAFIQAAKAWLVMNERLRDQLNNQSFQSPSEWAAFTEAFERVEAYIFGTGENTGKLDRDFWFADSPVNRDQRSAIGDITSAYPNEGEIIEEELRTWRGKTLTEEQYRLLQSFTALGAGINELLNNSLALSGEIDRLVAGAAIVAKDGVKCVATVAVAGDFGDFYELVSGKSICGGAMLSGSERMLSGLGLVIGNGTFWRGVARTTGLLADARLVSRLTESVVSKAHSMRMSKEELNDLAKRLNDTLPCSVGNLFNRQASVMIGSMPDCISPELTNILEDALGASSTIFTGGRHIERRVLGRRMLKLDTELSPLKPSFVDPNVNPSIKARIEGGETNLDLMKDGKAPIGSDGKQINLHHLFGKEPGPLAEIEATIHSNNHKVLHKMITESFRRDATKRNAYNSFRDQYWKERAKDFES